MDLLQVTSPGPSPFPGLEARVTAEQARRAFGDCGSRVSRALGLVRRRRLHAIADVYVPYHLFRVNISDAGREQSSWFALDAVTGGLDLYRFDDGPGEIHVIRSRNRVPAAIAAADAWPLLVAKLQRALFQTGFFRLRDPRVSGHVERTDLHVPYWLGFYEDGRHVRLRVLDGLRGRFEGGKARALFEEWLGTESDGPGRIASDAGSSIGIPQQIAAPTAGPDADAVRYR